MKFRITRTSYLFEPEKSPIEEEERLERKEYNLGDKKCKGWFIEIDSLDELMDLLESTECKRLVIQKEENRYINDHKITTVEIYDDYRE